MVHNFHVNKFSSGLNGYFPTGKNKACCWIKIVDQRFCLRKDEHMIGFLWTELLSTTQEFGNSSHLNESRRQLDDLRVAGSLLVGERIRFCRFGWCGGFHLGHLTRRFVRRCRPRRRSKRCSLVWQLLYVFADDWIDPEDDGHPNQGQKHRNSAVHQRIRFVRWCVVRLAGRIRLLEHLHRYGV